MKPVVLTTVFLMILSGNVYFFVHGSNPENTGYEDIEPLDPVQIENSGERTRSQSEPWVTFRYNQTHSGFIKNTDAPDTNQTLWTYDTQNSASGNGVYSSAAIVDGIVYIGTGGGPVGISKAASIVALYENNGTEVWNWSAPIAYFHGMASSPAVVNGKVFMGVDGAPRLWCLDAKNGSLIWEFNTGGALMEGIYSSPAVVNGRVYFGNDNDSVFCIPENDPNSDGVINSSEMFWEKNMGDNVWSSPTVVGGLVYVGAGDATSSGSNKFYALYASNGTTAWTFPKTGNIQDVLSTPAVINNRVYFGARDGNVYALYANNGTEIWTYTTGNEIQSSPAFAYNRIFIGSNDNKLYCLDAVTGQKIWDYTTGGTVISSPSVADGKVYFGSSDGKVYALNATRMTAQKIWEYYIGSGPSSSDFGICSSPSISNGKLVIGGTDPTVPKVWCFQDTDIIPPWITKTDPVDNATGVPTTVTITFEFSEQMDPATIISQNVQVKDSLDNSVSGTVNYFSQTRTGAFTPSAILKRGENYTVTVTAGTEDLAGLGLDGDKNGVSVGSPLDDYSWVFRTSGNIPPSLTSPGVTPTEGGLSTGFKYTVTYSDAENDTPETAPAYIRVYIDSEPTGRAMTLDTGAPVYLRDGNYTNSERYTYTTTLSPYGRHTYQFKCSDGIDTNETAVFNNTLVWFPQVLDTVADQNAVEDIDLVLDLSAEIIDEDTPLNSLILIENSSYAAVSGKNITFNYPNSFNYPSGRSYEMVNISLYDPVSGYRVWQTVKVNVLAVNDAPVIEGVPDITVEEGVDYKLDLSIYTSDEDNELSELTFSTDSNYSRAVGEMLIFNYPQNSTINQEDVLIKVYDGELYGYENITVTVLPVGGTFKISTIPDQSAVEDIPISIDLADYLYPSGSWIDSAVISINSSYGTVKGTTLEFLYPNSFNYPSGSDHEIVEVNVTYNSSVALRSFKIDVKPVNDAPVISVVDAPRLGVNGTPVSFRITYFDEDGGEDPDVTLIINEKEYQMDFSNGDIHGGGGTFERDLLLVPGNYRYYFQGDDNEDDINSIIRTAAFDLTILRHGDMENDTDGDSIPDSWEIEHGLDPFDPADGENDTDGDGYTNLQEYLGSDGLPGGGDSTDPNNNDEIPGGEPGGGKRKGGDKESGSSRFLWIILILIIFIIVVFMMMFLIARRRKKEGEDAYRLPPPPPPEPEFTEPLSPITEDEYDIGEMPPLAEPVDDDMDFEEE